jgi:hypothetical protein
MNSVLPADSALLPLRIWNENRMDVIERLLAGVREMPCYFKAA